MARVHAGISLALRAQISVGFEVFHHVPKGLTHALFSLLSVWWPDEHFRQSTTQEKDSFLPVLCCDMHEKHGRGWPPSPLAAACSLHSSFPPLPLWISRKAAASAMHFLPTGLMSSVLPKLPVTSSCPPVLWLEIFCFLLLLAHQWTLYFTSHLTLAPAAGKISLLTISAKPPTSPAHIPWSPFHKKYKESASKLNLQNQRKSAVN